MDETKLAMAIAVGLKTMSYRVLTILALILNAVMFGWAMKVGTWTALATAALFGVATWFLVKVSPFKESDTPAG